MGSEYQQLRAYLRKHGYSAVLDAFDNRIRSQDSLSAEEEWSQQIDSFLNELDIQKLEELESRKNLSSLERQILFILECDFRYYLSVSQISDGIDPLVWTDKFQIETACDSLHGKGLVHRSIEMNSNLAPLTCLNRCSSCCSCHFSSCCYPFGSACCLNCRSCHSPAASISTSCCCLCCVGVQVRQKDTIENMCDKKQCASHLGLSMLLEQHLL